MNFQNAGDYITKALISNHDLSIVIADRSGTVEYVNAGFTRMTAYRPEEIIGKNISILGSGEYDASFWESLWKTLVAGKSWVGEILSRNRDGVEFWEAARIAPVLDGDGAVSLCIKVSEDVTSQRRMMDALVRSYDFVESIMNNLHAIFVVDANRKLLQVNKIFANLTGYAAGEVVSRSFAGFFADPDREVVEEKLSMILSGGETVTGLEAGMIMKGERLRVVSLSIAPLRQEGRIIYAMGTLDDITERKQAESDLKKLFRAVEQSPASVVITDMAGNIEYVNPKFRLLTGYTPQEVQGRNPRILKSGAHSIEFYENLWKTILSGNEWRGEFLNRKKNNEFYWESASISPVRNKEGVITNFIGVKEDITDRKRAEEALRVSEENLRQKNIAMERDLQYAQLIIKSLLPREAPVHPRVRIDYRYQSLDAIGGDFFSFPAGDDGGMGVFIGDVAGHGVSAALFLSLVKSVSDRLGRLHGRQPAAFIKALNDELSDAMTSYFMTALYGFFSFDDSEALFSFAKGGHPPPLVYDARSGSVRLLRSRGKPISMVRDFVCEDLSVRLSRGDRLYLYTDGLNETENGDRRMLDYEGLIDIVQRSISHDLGADLDRIIERVGDFRGGADVTDDIVLIGFEIV